MTKTYGKTKYCKAEYIFYNVIFDRGQKS